MYLCEAQNDLFVQCISPIFIKLDWVEDSLPLFTAIIYWMSNTNISILKHIYIKIIFI